MEWTPRLLTGRRVARTPSPGEEGHMEKVLVALRGSNLKQLKRKIWEVLREDGSFLEQAAPIPEKEIRPLPVEWPFRRGGGPYVA